MDIALINIDIIRKYRKIAANFDVTRLAGFIFDAQIANLRPLIGAELYADLISNYTAPGESEPDKWQILVHGNGSDFYGCEPFLAYHILSAIAREGGTWITEKGFQTFSNAESQPTYNADRREMESDYKSKAAQFGNEIIEYLDKNSAQYPTYKNKSTKPNNGLNWFVV